MRGILTGHLPSAANEIVRCSWCAAPMRVPRKLQNEEGAKLLICGRCQRDITPAFEDLEAPDAAY